MLTPGKMAGDICKSVGEGLVTVAAFAGAVFTDGATLTIGLTALGAVMEASTTALRRPCRGKLIPFAGQHHQDDRKRDGKHPDPHPHQPDSRVG